MKKGNRYNVEGFVRMLLGHIMPILFLFILFSISTKSANSQVIITVRDTIYTGTSGSEVIEYDVDIDTLYNENIIFHILDELENDGRVSSEMISNICQIPVDTGCMGCDFEHPEEVTTQYWAASVDYFKKVTGNSIDRIIHDSNLSSSSWCEATLPTDPSQQCKCTGNAIATPAFYCPPNTEKFINFTFYEGCNPASPATNSEALNHFRLTDPEELYRLLNNTTPPTPEGWEDIKGHFGDTVMRLGDDYFFRKIASLIKRIVVDSSFLNFTFDYAFLVHPKDSHIDSEKPSFSVKIYNNSRENITFDNSGISRVDLGWGDNEIISNHPHLKTLGNYVYMDWSCGKINLSDFNIGDTVYIVFEQRDCGGGGTHWSKVYIDNIGNGMCESLQDGIIHYQKDMSYTCGDTVFLTFNYQLPGIVINDTNHMFGELQIELNLFENTSSPVSEISSGIILDTSGVFTFKIPKSQLDNYVEATFTYSATSVLSGYNLTPYIHREHIPLPTADICAPHCAEFSSLPRGTNVENSYLLDERFRVKSVDNPSVNIVNIKQGQQFKAYTGMDIINGCLDTKANGSGITSKDKKNHLLFEFREPVEAFSLRMLDYDGKKFKDATIYKVFLKAYDSTGLLLDVDSLTTITGGDFCTALPSSKFTATKHTADYTFYTRGHLIKEVELSFYNNTLAPDSSDFPVDRNIAIAGMCYIPCDTPDIWVDEFTCFGDTLYMTDAKYRADKSYFWTGPNGFTASTAEVSIPNANSFHNGMYVLRSYSPNCGELFDTIHIDMDNSRIRRLGENVILCEGQSKTLNATSPSATYLWSTGQTTATISVDTTGQYWVAVSKDGCTKYDTVKVTFIGNPALEGIPYKTRHNCIEDNSGILQLLWNQKIGGILTEGTNSDVVTYIEDLSYDLSKDDLLNNTYDAQCSMPYGSGVLAAGWADSLFITGLIEGDYKIIIKPNTICRKVMEEGLAIDSVCISYNQCYEDSISFTFTIRKHVYPPPLEDRVLCLDSTVWLSVPSHYYDNLPPESIRWGSVCGIYDLGYDISATVADNIFEDTLRALLSNGRGGVHTVEIVTQDGCIIRDTAVVADLKPLIMLDTMPSALATNAVNYTSFWSTQYNNIRWEDAEELDYFVKSNIFFNGEAGIPRPHKNHDYLDSLNSTIGFTHSYTDPLPSTQLEDIDIRSAGNIMPYKLFNYGNPLFVECAPEWVHNSTMTKYSPSGFDIENKDIMGIYSSALYGYNDMLPIAVASNAKNDEIGFESFEEYSKDVADTVNYYNTLTQLNNSTGNIDLVRQTESLMMPKSRDFEIVRAFNRYAMIRGNICSACDEPISVFVNAQTVPVNIGEEGVYIDEKKFESFPTVVMASPCGDSSYTILQLQEGSVCQTFDPLKCSFWVGNIKVIEETFVPLIENIGFELDDTRAHTGNYSLKVPKDELIFLPQVEMALKPRETYHIGAWIHSASMETLSPEALKQSHIMDSIGILVKLPNNEVVFIRPSGEVIDGWQRMEGTFTMPVGSRTQIHLGFHSMEDFNIDDIRIYPQNSAIQTYVYDRSNYKVRAVLDQNNYATVYHYDEEGNLFAIKKETVKGIKTIQLSGSHLKSER